MTKLRLPKPKASVRPTSSKVRSAIFNMLPAEVLEGARVLDAYAGTGALGFEAFEHGAAQVDFVDQDPEMCRRIRESLASAGLAESGHVYRATMKKAMGFLTESYDLVFMDPSYADPKIGDTMAVVTRSPILKKEGLLVVEHAWRAALPEHLDGLLLLRMRRYGDTVVSIYRREPVLGEPILAPGVVPLSTGVPPPLGDSE